MDKHPITYGSHADDLGGMHLLSGHCLVGVTGNTFIGKIGGSPIGHGALTCGHVIGGSATEGSSLGKVSTMGGDNTMPVNV